MFLFPLGLKAKVRRFPVATVLIIVATVIYSVLHFNSTGHSTSLSVQRLFEAMFSHAGWLHLVGNLIFFLFIAIAVEERVGSLAFLAVYILAGATGDLTQLFLSQDSLPIVQGASSGAAGIAGLFLVLFWKLEMRLWVSAFMVISRVLLIPTKFFIPALVLASVLFNFVANPTQTSHWAHLGGLLFGAAVGLAWMLIKPVREGTVFPFEAKLLEAALATPDTEEKLSRLAEVLYHHPENQEALELALVTILQEATTPWETLESKTRRFIKRNFEAIFVNRLYRDSAQEFVEFAASIPADWPLEIMLKKVEFTKLQAVVAECQSQGRFAVAARLLRVLIATAEGRIKEQLEEYLASIEKEIASDQTAA